MASTSESPPERILAVSCNIAIGSFGKHTPKRNCLIVRFTVKPSSYGFLQIDSTLEIELMSWSIGDGRQKSIYAGYNHKNGGKTTETFWHSKLPHIIAALFRAQTFKDFSEFDKIEFTFETSEIDFEFLTPHLRTDVLALPACHIVEIH